MHKYLTIIILLLCLNGIAQDRDIVNVNYSASKLSYENTTATTRLLEVKLRIPIYHNDSTTFITAINYKNLVLSSFPSQYTNNLQGISAQFVYNRILSDSRSIAVFAQAGIFSDFKDISGEDFRYGGGFNYNIKHSYRLTSGWGLFYARQFFGNQIVPFISINYQPNNRWSVTGQLPVKEKILYHFNDKTSAGVELSGEGNSYRLSASENQSNYVKVTQWAALAKFEYKFTRSWQLNAGMGSNVIQNYELFANGSTSSWTIITSPLGKKQQPLQQVKNRGFTAQIGISYIPF